jgi:hypothetical protein
VPRAKCRSREAEAKHITRQNSKELKQWRMPRESLLTTAIIAIVGVPGGGIGFDSSGHAMCAALIKTHT